jgi:hypothetical protein
VILKSIALRTSKDVYNEAAHFWARIFRSISSWVSLPASLWNFTGHENVRAHGQILEVVGQRVLRAAATRCEEPPRRHRFIPIVLVTLVFAVPAAATDFGINRANDRDLVPE